MNGEVNMKVYNFGKRLKYYRNQAGLTQSELAEKINKSIHHITQIERGINLPSLPLFLDICIALNIPADCFLIDEDRHFAEHATVELIDKLKKYSHEELKTAVEIYQSILFGIDNSKNDHTGTSDKPTNGG
jgi:transcriptional regulator with XRE-family HTH domain